MEQIGIQENVYHKDLTEESQKEVSFSQARHKMQVGSTAYLLELGRSEKLRALGLFGW